MPYGCKIFSTILYYSHIHTDSAHYQIFNIDINRKGTKYSSSKSLGPIQIKNQWVYWDWCAVSQCRCSPLSSQNYNTDFRENQRVQRGEEAWVFSWKGEGRTLQVKVEKTRKKGCSTTGCIQCWSRGFGGINNLCLTITQERYNLFTDASLYL